jgi:hypothetical protein
MRASCFQVSLYCRARMKWSLIAPVIKTLKLAIYLFKKFWLQIWFQKYYISQNDIQFLINKVYIPSNGGNEGASPPGSQYIMATSPFQSFPGQRLASGQLAASHIKINSSILHLFFFYSFAPLVVVSANGVVFFFYSCIDSSICPTFICC